MSSTTPSSTQPNEEGPCVVCNKPTSNRCADCLKHGTDYMWFCSIEHKKLVYSVHRRVCGIRSSPFQWPGLSPQEVTEWREGQCRIVAYSCSRASEEAEEADSFAPLREPPRGKRMDPESLEHITAHRYSRFGFILGQKKTEMPEVPEAALFHQLSNIHLFDAAIYLQELKFPGLATQPERFGEWWTPLQHKILIFHALRQEASKHLHWEGFTDLLLLRQRDFYSYLEKNVMKPMMMIHGEEALEISQVLEPEGLREAVAMYEAGRLGK